MSVSSSCAQYVANEAREGNIAVNKVIELGMSHGTQLPRTAFLCTQLQVNASDEILVKFDLKMPIGQTILFI